jgi:hypothetical protein
MSADGLGVQRILHHLVAHPEKHPPFGDSGRWRDSYVLQILSNKAAYGEFQPGMRDDAGRKVECGEPIKSYFPPVVNEERFYQVQAGMKARFRVLGRPGEFETNLFTGIVFHAEDRTKMSVHTFRQATTEGGETRPYRYLTSDATALPVAEGLSFRTHPSSRPLYGALRVDAGRRAGGEEQGRTQAEIADDRQAGCDRSPHQDAEQKAADPDEGKPEVHVRLHKTLHKAKKETVRRLEELKAEAASCKAVNLGEVQSLLGLLGSVKGDELKEVRRKLKAKVRSVVSEIWVHITRVTHMTRVAQVQIHLRNGTITAGIQHTSGAGQVLQST